MEVVGANESYALLPISATPPPIAAFAGLGPHAIAFSGEAELFNSLLDDLEKVKDALDDADDFFSWDLDITVGPEWREVRTAAPLVAVTQVMSDGADEDDKFAFGVEFRTPKWTVDGVSGQQKIVLHVSVSQGGERLWIHRLGYTVTATGSLRHPEMFVP